MFRWFLLWYTYFPFDPFKSIFWIASIGFAFKLENVLPNFFKLLNQNVIVLLDLLYFLAAEINLLVDYVDKTHYFDHKIKLFSSLMPSEDFKTL